MTGRLARADVQDCSGPGFLVQGADRAASARCAVQHGVALSAAMPWQSDYRAKLVTAERALASVEPGETIFLGGNAATPRVLARALAERALKAPGLRVAHVLLMGEDPFAEAAAQGAMRHLSWFVGPADRDDVHSGTAGYVPCHLSDIPWLIRNRTPSVHTALLMTSPPDAHGFLSLGVEVMASLAAAEVASRVIVQVNPRMPRVHGNSFLHLSEVQAIVEAEEPLLELPIEPPSEVERRIAAHVAPLVPERATLQLGIGGVPNAVLELLEGRDDLGIHSEMISDSVMTAVQRGVVTGRYKTRHRRKTVMTFALGSRVFYDWLHENPFIEAHPCDHVNDPFSAAQNERLTSINSALSIDLTGQVCADSIGHRIWSGVGGQVDFVRAARRSPGGVSVIALPSTAKDGGVSRIVPTLAPGAGVVTSRADVHWVVTEHGAADLRGLTLPERAEALTAIADPKFRDELRATAAPSQRER